MKRSIPRTILLSALVLAAVLSTRFVRLNISPSVPYGVYTLSAVPASLAPGLLVVLPPPAAIWPWWPSLTALMKPVAAVAGEEVCAQGGNLVVHGEAYGPIYTEAQGKPLPHLEGCQRVPTGQVFLASREPKSLDGRYWGFTSIGALTTSATPLLIWR